MKKQLITATLLLVAMASSAEAREIELYAVPGALSSECDKTTYYSPQRRDAPYLKCLVEITTLTLDYIAFIPVINQEGLIPERERQHHIKTAKKLFTYFTEATSNRDILYPAIDAIEGIK